MDSWFVLVLLVEWSIVLAFSAYTVHTGSVPRAADIALRHLALIPLYVLVAVTPTGGPGLDQIIFVAAFALIALSDTLIVFSFPLGMASFLMTHLVLIFGFWRQAPATPVWSFVVLAAVLAAGLIFYFKVFYSRVSTLFRLVLPVYLLVLSVELWRGRDLDPDRRD